MLKKIWNVITVTAVALIVIFAVLLVGVRIAGLEVFSVLSGSMEPKYSTGDLLYVKRVDYTALKPGDVITYLLSENTVSTHRIVEVIADENDPSVLRFRTKGDANDSADAGLVHYKNIIGVPVFSIPLLGYVASYISEPPGMHIAIGSCAMVIILVFLPDLFGKEERSKRARKHGRYERLDEQ